VDAPRRSPPLSVKLLSANGSPSEVTQVAVQGHAIELRARADVAGLVEAEQAQPLEAPVGHAVHARHAQNAGRGGVRDRAVIVHRRVDGVAHGGRDRPAAIVAQQIAASASWNVAATGRRPGTTTVKTRHELIADTTSIMEIAPATR
jgi:hypothetical protein